MGIGLGQEEVQIFAQLVHCKASKLPFVYLGLPVGENMRHKSSWNGVVDTFYKKLGGGKLDLYLLGGG